MIQNELSKAKDQDLIASVLAMKRAASLARQVAVQTGTAIVVTKDEKIIRRTAAELMTESLPDTNKPAAL
ncbi:MAG: hypothetical protein ING30_11235 [Burkholderiales bacterium]|jgi:hypothetical protein|nr:hypothetical protein [Burkholderiales bacterium]MCA3156972.1 hypothetical protein [Burkholderiales bacterium]